MVQSRSGILIITNVARDGAAVRANLSEVGFQSTITHSCQRAESVLHDDTFDAILIANNNGCCQCAWACRLRNRIDVRHVPLVILPNESPAADITSTSDFPTRLKQFLQRFNECAKGHHRLELRGIKLDPIADKVTHRGKPIRLSPIEFRLLAHFMSHPDQIFTQQQLLKDVWRRNSAPGRTVGVHVAKLRKALADHKANSLIRTVPGCGYVFKSGRTSRAAQLSASQAALEYTTLHVGPRPRRRRTSGQRALRPRERSLLGLLILNPGVTFTRECIASLIWGSDEVDLRIVDATVSRIRQVFLQHALRNPIRGVVGRGYQINANGMEPSPVVLASLARPTKA